MSLNAEKNNLRRSLRKRIAQLTPPEKQEASRQVCTHLLAHPVWHKATLILLYAPLPDEVDIWPLVEAALGARRRVALPRYSEATQGYEPVEIVHPQADLTVGRFGVREPMAHCPSLAGERLDLMLIPGLGFSRTGERLGRGLGYYDRLLDGLEGARCGLAFDCQLHEGLPKEPHDQRMDMLLTPTLGVVWTQQANA